MTTTQRPDIAFTVGTLSHKLQQPTQGDLRKALELGVYVYQTRSKVLTYANPSSGLLSYADASFNGEIEKCTAIFGSLTLLAGGPVDWTSKKIQRVIKSTKDAELYAFHHSMFVALRFMAILHELGMRQHGPVPICEDNDPLIAALSNLKPCEVLRHLRPFFKIFRRSLETEL